MTASPLRIDCVHDARLCHAMQQNAVALVPQLRLVNAGEAPLADLEVRVRLEPDLAPEWTARIAAIAPGAAATFADLPIALRPEALANATERQLANLRVEVRTAAGELVAHQDHAIEVLAYNEWPGAGSQPALLAAFVLPNHPAVAPILRDAAARLAATTGNAALDGYRTRDPRRALLMAQAIYEALQALQIAYVQPPASFERTGQKVRTPEQVASERLGTCLDLAVLYAACLEQAGLHALLVVTEGHALAGVWLADEVFAEAAPADPLPLKKRVELERIALVECTVLCSTQTQPFARARELGARAVAADAAFLFAVDVAMARRTGMRPLASRTAAFAAVEPAAEAAAVESAPPLEAEAIAPPLVTPTADVEPAPPRPPEDRLARWQRRLLDLSLRNRLLNFTAGKRTVPLQVHGLEELVAALGGGATFAVLPQVELPASTAAPAGGDPHASEQQRAVFLQKELQGRRLHGAAGRDDLDARMLAIWRQARTSSEESGVNTLFLALGFLRWYETPTSSDERRAPLLLLPLRIERVSLAEGFAVALADEEARVNETLVQKLHLDFGIDVEVEAGEGDDDGPTVGAVLDAFRRAIVDVDRWEVEATACIGCFSFAKYLMWVDLAERRRELLEHALLRHLIETPERAFADDGGDWPQPAQLDAVDPREWLCPMDADSSQLCAVRAGADGRSFVLEGPPGTGKSQTIANLIAQCLGNGQRVLFVAEKRAALEVVQRRLAAVGLSPFCLELHSGKGQKRSVVQQLGRALELAQQGEPAQWQKLAEELRVARHALNEHVLAVHRVRVPGFSVFAATATAIAGRALPQVEGLPTDGDEAWLRAAREAVAMLAGSGAPLEPLRQHPWFGVRRPDWHPGLHKELVPRLDAATAAVEPARSAHAAVVRLLQLDGAAAGTSRRALRALAELAAVLAGGPVPAGLLAANDFAAAQQRLLQIVAVGRLQAEGHKQLAVRWHDALLQLDVAGLHAALLRHGARSWLLRWWHLRSVRRELAAVARGPLPPTATLHEDLQKALVVIAQREALQGADADAALLLGAAWRGRDSDFDMLAQLLERAGRVHALVQQLVDTGADAARLLQRCAEVGGDRAAAPALQAMAVAQGELGAAVTAVGDLLQLCPDRAFGDEAAPGQFDRVLQRLQTWAGAAGSLREMCAFQRDAAAARALGLEPLERALEAGTVDAAALPAVFERSFAESWLAAVFAQDAQLRAFRGQDHERRIDRFRQLDRDMIALAGKVVVARLCASLPALRSTGAESSELGLLLRELKKQRRHLPPRQLFARIPNLLARLAPCLLMSPMTVAQVLSRRSAGFDVVVFDEASQVPVWDAVGAISRGRSLIVVGDSRQLPPTQFFQRLDGDGDVDLDIEPVDELESVLDECAAAGLQRLHLRWHYRSRHESLIAFSNHHYYENRLLTFPSPEHGGALGVRLVPVAGVYDRARSQTNRIEAEALVRELVARLCRTDGARLSYGVVTFSQPQQELVEDLLDRERQLHPEIERHFAADGEPVFVKNLENVQGDERDVMLFSICYGPDAAGKVHMNFGPLNLQGGERRLNVAVTRARQELLVFSSLRAEQIELQRTQSLGARHLRAFLDYAARGALALAAAVARDPSADCESPFERAVLQALRLRGCEVHAQVGCSGYRIDLAIVDPRASGRYVLGVECDGAAYHASATARDRDRLRQSVLERLGWRLFRIWSTDWWLDPEGELRRFDQALAAALRAPVAPPPPPPVHLAAPAAAASVPAIDPTPASEASAPAPLLATAVTMPLYTAAALEPLGDAEAFHATRNTAKVQRQVAAVLAAEAPIKFELLARRVAAAWSIGRTTERVRERVRLSLPSATVEQGDALWPDAAAIGAFAGFRGSPLGAAARDAELLPAIEVEAAMAWVVRQHGSLGEDDLLRETARQFGFARLGTSVRAAMAAGLEVLLRRSVVQQAAGVVRPADAG